MKWQGTGNEIRHGIYLTKGVHNVLCKTWIDPNSLETVSGLVPFSGLYLVQMEAKFCFCCFTPVPGPGPVHHTVPGQKMVPTLQSQHGNPGSGSAIGVSGSFLRGCQQLHLAKIQSLPARGGHAFCQAVVPSFSAKLSCQSYKLSSAKIQASQFCSAKLPSRPPPLIRLWAQPWKNITS